jgi:5-methylcytosine-specific restriction endonuclease McrA
MERYGVPVVADLFTKADVVSRYGDACAYCGGEFQELDHFIPLKAGGTHVLSNVWPSCTPCNRTKGKLDLETVALAKVGDGCRG